MNDTLMNPLSYETLDEDSNVQHALNEAKVIWVKNNLIHV